MAQNGLICQIEPQTIALLETPVDHRAFLAPEQRGEMIAWRKGQKPAWPKVPSDAHKAVQDQLSKWVDQPDTFITPNEFHGWRVIKLLARINALYVDIDMHDASGDVDMQRMAWDAVAALERANAPLPNVIVYTGRGIHLYWTLAGGLPATALPRWQACQRALVKLLQGDPQSADATRVLRMIGTTNTKANNWKVTAEVVVPQRYTFDELADAILPFTRAEIRDISAARARKKAEKGPRKASGTIFDRWYHVYRDLHRILDFHWFGGVPEGHRNNILFHLSNALSWFTRYEALRDEINAIARTQIPSLSSREVQEYTGSIVKRAQEAAQGQFRKHNDQKVDPRYRYRRQTLYDALSPLIPSTLLPNMRAIIPDELAHERKQTRDKSRYADSNTGLGFRQGNVEKRAQALKMRSQGLPITHIAQTLSVDPKTIRRWAQKR